MKKMRLTLLFLLVAMVACGQGQKIRGTLETDTLKLKEFASPPAVDESGYLLNVAGEIWWHNGTDWDTLNVGGSGGSGWVPGDTVMLDSLAYMLTDSIPMVFGMGINHPNDTAGCFDGAIAGCYPNQQDTLYARMIDDAIALGTSPDVDMRIVYDVNPFDATPTVIWSGTLTGTANNSTTFTNRVVPPNVHIWGEVDGDPTTKANLLYLPLLFSKIRQVTY